MGPEGVVNQRPLSSEQSWQGRASGRETKKADVWVPRATRSCNSEHSSLSIPVSCRSGRCDLVSTPEAWGTLALTPPQPSPQAKDQRRQRPGPKSQEKQRLSFLPGHSHQLLVTNDDHTCPSLLD